MCSSYENVYKFLFTCPLNAFKCDIVLRNANNFEKYKPIFF